MEEIRDVTYGLWGYKLPNWQSATYLVRAGFHDPRVLLNMFAIIMGESGSYLNAWHANVRRTPEDNILYDIYGNMTVKSIDLGYIQKNVEISPDFVVQPTAAAMKPLVEAKFAEFPGLADAQESAYIAYDLYLARGFAPWYAYKPGTPEWQLKKKSGAKAIADFLIHTQVGKIDGKLPKLVWVD